MREELLSWFEHEGLLLTSVTMGADDPEHDEIKMLVRAPVLALSRASHDFRECPDPARFGYPEGALESMTLDDMHQFVLRWFEQAVEANMARCFVCNQILQSNGEKPWDAVFVRHDMYCWLVVHFDCKRYLDRDLKGRNPFEVTISKPESFDIYVRSSHQDSPHPSEGISTGE
jgi:hypothetical protein